MAALETCADACTDPPKVQQRDQSMGASRARRSSRLTSG
jgi:hypothetical protein